ncbi:MAG: sugar phosphate isomerase/epimerase [Chloroflexi bacterium]|nr:sugar phosphate isomerase/epimerase [Chloroflexota bacterium]
MNKSFLDRLAVCSWSLQPAHPHNLLQQTQQIGIPRLQCALDPLREHPAVWGQFPELGASAGITLVSGMFGTIGEDYSTLETIRQTGGVVPDATWPDNWKNIQATASLAEQIGLKLVTFHAGFLPHEETDPAFQKLFDRVSRIADLFASKNIALGFETGQETAVTLRAFLEKLNRPTVGVNFDPANMILYDKGDPIAALRTLGPWLKQCHVKDALKTKQPGTWGEEVVVGTGEVDWHAFLRTLEELNFGGFCCIEREAGRQRIADIRAARDFIESILACG